MSPAFRLSLAVNLVLVVLVAGLFWRDRSRPPASGPHTAAPARTDVNRPAPPAVASALAPRRRAPSPDGALDPATVAQIEALGLSRGVLVSALIEHFNRRWDQRLLELEKHYAPRAVPEREYVEFGRRREAERIRELTSALGEEGYRAWDKEQTLRLLNGPGVPLSPEEAEQAYLLQKEFEAQHRELQMAMEDGVADLADGAALQAGAQEARDRALEALLGRERLRAMQGLGEPIAEVQARYGDLNLTREQAQAVLAIEEDHRAREAALAERLKQQPDDAAAIAAELKALHAAREERLAEIFGAEAVAAQQRRLDPTYRTLTQYAETWGLQPAEVEAVYAQLHVLHDGAERARAAAALREAAGQAVNWRELNATLDQARQQTELALHNLIGRDRLWRLKQNGLLTGR